MNTRFTLLTLAYQLLQDAQVPNYKYDSQVLLAHVLNMDLFSLLLE